MPKPMAVSMGDPAGIGPEIVAKLALARPNACLVVCGDADVLGHYAPVRILAHPYAAEPGLNVIHDPCAVAPIAGKGDPRNAPAIKRWIEQAVRLVQAQEAEALLTAPINKAVLAKGADFPYPGHTEFLAALDHKDFSVMMLSDEANLRVVLATVHIPLADVSKHLDRALLERTIKVTHAALLRYGFTNPRFVVAGLNPHAGEDGLMGNEEMTWIAPLIEDLAQAGYNIRGPYPADTLFHPRARAGYDVAVAMYHDQGLIPIKTIAFDQGVNVTLGLDFLRASPDHGTAYDLAGRGLARADSMIAAYDLLERWTRVG